VAQAIDFLACHADPTRIAGMDPIMTLLLSVAAGTVKVEEAHANMTRWVNNASLVITTQSQPA
jgi:hypothetical protein